jgi:ribosome maturation factor RimP
VTPEDFRRFIGETIKVKMQPPLLGRKNFSGRLVDVTPDHVVLEVDKEHFDLAFDGMERARLVPRFRTSGVTGERDDR